MRKDYKKSVDSGRKSGKGRVVFTFYDLREFLWEGSGGKGFLQQSRVLIQASILAQASVQDESVILSLMKYVSEQDDEEADVEAAVSKRGLS